MLTDCKLETVVLLSSLNCEWHHTNTGFGVSLMEFGNFWGWHIFFIVYEFTQSSCNCCAMKTWGRKVFIFVGVTFPHYLYITLDSKYNIICYVLVGIRDLINKREIKWLQINYNNYNNIINYNKIYSTDYRVLIDTFRGWKTEF